MGNDAFSSVNPNSNIMVYRTNSQPFIAPLCIQNEEICTSQYILATTAEFGESIDSERINGLVCVKSGIDYQLEAKEKVVLNKGFKVEKGAKFRTIKALY